MLYQIEFSGIVGAVDVVIKASFYVHYHFLAFLVCGILVRFRCFADGILHQNVFPLLIVRVELGEYMHHLLESAHRESTGAAGGVKNLAVIQGVHD